MGAREEMLDSRARVPDAVVHRRFEAETLLLNLDTGRYHGLTETGARMVELLRETGSIRDSVERLARECGVEFDAIAGEMADFCAELEDRGLIEVSRE